MDSVAWLMTLGDRPHARSLELKITLLVQHVSGRWWISKTDALGGDQEQFLVFLSFNHCSLTKQNLHIKVPVSLFQCISLLNCKQCCLRLKSFFFLKSLFSFFPKPFEYLDIPLYLSLVTHHIHIFQN